MTTSHDLVQCATCGVERDAAGVPELCPICVDERQYVGADGQRWVRPDDVGARLDLVEREPGLHGLALQASFGIGQEAKLVSTPEGTVMVDVPAVIDEEAVRRVRELGPVLAIVPTHPHMYGVQSLWSQALDDAPVWVAEADQEWLGHRPGTTRTWSGTEHPAPGVTASQPGGHFPGSAVVHWTGADGRGVLLVGDTVLVNPDRRTVSFMRSYPNMIPLSAAVVRRIAAHLAGYDCERVYSNFGPAIEQDGAEALAYSARRHCAWVEGEHDDLT